ncbi:MAG: alkaline phosphatase D family protein [Xanthobacteraceae bacterium]
MIRFKTAPASHKGISRRALLRHGAAGLAGIATNSIAAPYLSFAASRPVISHGLQSGDVCSDGAVIWARTDRPARMLVEASTTESFQSINTTGVADAFPESDFTAKLALEGLPAGSDIFYRVRFQDHASPTISGEAQHGRFRTAPLERHSVSFAWSGDTAGQGFGIDEAKGGMRTFSTMLKHRPDFFIHSGDSIYADCAIPSTVTLPDGGIWNNLVTEEKSKVAETLTEFRGNYKYNLLDQNVRAFNAQVPIFAQWDDHEVTNDWVPGESVTWERYTEKSILALAARGGRAFHEFMPTRQPLAEAGRVYRRIAYGPLLDIFMVDMRAYRTPNSLGDASEIFGAAQLAWLKRELMNSRATWKVIAADLPIGLISDDAVALGDGPPQGREVEIADLLAFIKHGGISNTVWLTADMHYTAAHYYDPNRAVFQDFEPFWEFVSGPLHAGTWSPTPLDNTFGSSAVFRKGCAPGQPNSLAPCFGLQFFGHVAIDGETEVMTVSLRDVNDAMLWSTAIEPKRSRPRAQVQAHG